RFSALGLAPIYARITTCLDAQHQYVDIAQRQRQQPAQLAAIAAVLAPTTPRLTAVGVATGTAVVAAGLVAVRGRAGPKQALQSHTHLLKCSHLSKSARPLRGGQLRNLTYVTYSCAMRGTTAKVQPK